MNQNRCYLALLLFSLFFSTSKGEDSKKLCDDWVPFKDERCIKIIVGHPEVKNYEEAVEYCRVFHKGYLLTIDSKNKQKFVEDLLKKESIKTNIYIGLKYVNAEKKRYQWSESTEVSFTNWEVGSPRNDSNFCTQLKTEDDINFGKWFETACDEKRDLTVCEKVQELLPVDQLQIKIMNLLKYQIKMINKMDNQMKLINTVKNEIKNDVKNELTVVQNNIKDLIPTGFIYKQLPNEKSPEEIWPGMKWKDVSSDYANLFFRVVGNKAEPFGKEQQEGDRYLRYIESYNNFSTNYSFVDLLNPTSNGWSNHVRAFGTTSYNYNSFRFYFNKAEVRPLNKAIKIWKRMP